MSLFKKIRSSMSASAIGALVGLIFIFGLAISLVGYFSLDNAYRKEYSTVTYHMADSVTVYVNGDHLDDYLSNYDSYKDEYEETKNDIQTACYKLNVSLIYVIKVDTSDYNSFVSIFNVVYNEVDNSNYTPWELGYERKTTNDDYKRIYRLLYSKESTHETIFRIRTTDGQHPHITTLVPILGSDNEVTGLLCMQRPAREMAKAMTPYFLAIIFTAIILGVVDCVLAVLLINKSIIKPINRISKEASRFAKEGSIGESFGKISPYEIISDLAHSIESMEQDTVKYIENLTAFTAEQERMGAELSIASNIQRDSLPNIEKILANRQDFDIFASMDPAKEVGGDFYNFFFIDDDHLALVIADVSGKGIPAALFMMVTNIIISDRAQMGGTPAEILEYTNENIYQHNRASMFVTVWLGILELSTGKLITANAGHEDPIIYRKKHNAFIPNSEQHGFILGGFGGIKYQNNETILDKGDKLFIFTDGLSEAKNVKHEMYSVERIIKALNDNKEKSPKEILDNVTLDVTKFVGEEPQFDDLTMLCVERK